MGYDNLTVLKIGDGWYAPLRGAWLPPKPHYLALLSCMAATPQSDVNSANATSFPTNETDGTIQPCPVDRYNPWINDVERISYVYVMPAICTLCILLNAMTILVLSRKSFKGTSFVMLMALEATDIVTASLTFPFGFTNGSRCAQTSPLCRVRLTWVLSVYLPLANMSEQASSWLTVVLALDRFVAVRDPAAHKGFYSKRRARILISSVFFASVIINSPYFFVFRIVDDKESGDLRKTYTAWAVSAGFSVFSWVRGTLAQFLPLVALLCLNVLLLLTIRRSKERCRKVSAFSQTARRQAAQIRLTSMLVGTIVLFVCGNVPVAFAYSAIFDAVFGTRRKDPSFYASFRAITHVLAMLSYALGFVVYCISNRHFREVFIQVAYAALHRQRRKVSDLSIITPPSPIVYQHTTPMTIKVAPSSDLPRKL